MSLCQSPQVPGSQGLVVSEDLQVSDQGRWNEGSAAQLKVEARSFCPVPTNQQDATGAWIRPASPNPSLLVDL